MTGGIKLKFYRQIFPKFFDLSMLKSQKPSKPRHRAFSLVEVSAVLIIIGILIAGVFAGISLVKKFRIQAAQNLTKSSPISGISSNALWLESSLEDSFLDSESNDTSAISTWTDQKVTGNKLSITRVGTGPTYANTINYIHAVKFSGSTSNYLKIADASFLNGTNDTIVVLEKRQAANAGNFLSTTDTSDAFDNKLAIGYASDGVINHSHNSTNYTVSAYTDSIDKPRLFVFTQSSTEGQKTYINGTLAAQDTSKTTLLSGVTTLAIGKGYTGEIGEIAIFTKALSIPDRKVIEDYIGKKWTRKLNRSVVGSGITGGTGDTSSNPSCIGGTVTDSASSGCDNSCTVSVTGVSTPSSVVDGASGNLTCNTSLGYSGTIAYNCSGGDLHASPSACASTTCTITSVTGFNDQTGLAYAASETALSSPCATNYTPSTSPAPSYTCTTSGSATITGTCTLSAPTNSVAPTLSASSAAVGTAISVSSTGTWSPTPTSYTYAWWWSDGTPAAISGATSSSYTPVSGDAGHTLICKVSATNSGGTSTSPASSNATSAVTNPPTNSVAPALSSTSPVVGTAVTVTTGTWSGSPSSYTYQWWRADGTPAAISGATSSSYTPVSGDVGRTLLCKVTATGSGGTSSEVSSNTSSAVAATAGVDCTGGTITTPTISGTTYTLHQFTSSGTLTCTTTKTAKILVVAGGGGGGGVIGGGGGAGGLIYQSSYALSASNYSITVGSGGNGGSGWNTSGQDGKVGTNSVFDVSGVTQTLTAIGGGGGGYHAGATPSGNKNGGSGGGRAAEVNTGSSVVGTGTSGQGNNGGDRYGNGSYLAGGGGGAGSVGANASSTVGGNGGSGVNYSSTFGTSVGNSGWFASGGGGGVRNGSGSGGTASSGGGGNGTSTSVKAGNGLANTGGGGGGAGYNTDTSSIIGGNGGSGVVIILYPSS